MISREEVFAGEEGYKKHVSEKTRGEKQLGKLIIA